MLIKDTGIVISATRSGETSLRVLFLGRTGGKLWILAKGAMSARHPTRGVLEPGNRIDVVLHRREGQATHYLKEASLVAHPAAGRDSLPHMAAAFAALELLDQVCVSGGSLDESIVDVASDYLASPPALDPLFAFLAFEIRLLDVLGVAPDTVSCVRCGAPPDAGSYSPRDGVSLCAEHRTSLPESVHLSAGVVAAAADCASEPYENIARAAIPAPVRKELGRLVHWTYTYHVHGYRLPRSLNLI